MSKTIDANLKEYYSKRALEYDKIYSRNIPLRLKEQKTLATTIQKTFKDKHVLEIACGTGYWTQYLVKKADKVLATDISEEMLRIASRRVSSRSVQFLLGDGYNAPKGIPGFSGAMANFWISHVPKDKLHSFLTTLNSRLSDNAIVFFADDVYREDQGGELIKKKGSKDTWKKRKLGNNKEYLIVKNYYSKKELTSLFSRVAKNLKVIYMDYFWFVTFTVKK